MILNVFCSIAPVKLTLLPQMMKATSFIVLLTFFAGSWDQKTRGLPTWVSKTSLSLFLAFFGCGAKSVSRQLFHNF